MDWNTIIITAIGLVFGGGLFAQYIQLRTLKSTQLKAKAEAESVDIDNHKKMDDRWEKFTDKLEDNHKTVVDQMDKRITLNELSISKLENKLDDTNRKLEQKKYSVNRAYICSVPSEKCPVILSEIEFDQKNKCHDCDRKYNNK